MLPIYIISLKQDIEKRKVISRTLEDFGLEFRFIDAIHGKELSNDVVNSARRNSRGNILRRGFLPTPNEIGCTLSHLKAYKDILDNNLSWACILEDDAILDKSFKTFIEDFQETKLDPKRLYLLGGQNGLDEVSVVKSKKNHIHIAGQKFTKTIKSEKYIYRTCCYLVSSYLAENMIRLSENNFVVADDWAYLVDNKIINAIYLSNFVDHPLDLSASRIQKEREIEELSATSNGTYIKNIFSACMNSSIKRHFRLMSLKLYTYIEGKDKT